MYEGRIRKYAGIVLKDDNYTIIVRNWAFKLKKEAGLLITVIKFNLP